MSTKLGSRSPFTVACFGFAAGLGLTFLLLAAPVMADSPGAATPQPVAQGGPGDCDIYVTYYFHNRTTKNLTLKSSNLSWGKWVWAPPSQMEAGQDYSFRASGRCGSWTGTEGTVEYQINDAALDTLIITFDVPYSGSNSGNAWVTGSGAGSYAVTGGRVPTGGDRPAVYPYLTESQGVTKK